MGFFGINLLDAAKEQRLVSLPQTHLIGSSLELPGQTIVLPVELARMFNEEQLRGLREDKLKSILSHSKFLAEEAAAA